jgi:cytochrome c-type biogenesis protein
LPGILAALLANAVLDSVNPCTFYIYALLVTAATLKAGHNGATRVAAGFVAGVYTGYLALGLATAAALQIAAARLPAWLLSLLLAAYAVVLLAQAAREARGGRPILRHGSALRNRVLRAAGSPVAAYLLGLLASFTLLPCSSGPLLAFLALATGMGYSLAEVAALLLLYNLVFVAPLAAVGLAAGAAARTRRLEELLTQRAWLADTLVALMLLAAAAIMLRLS